MKELDLLLAAVVLLLFLIWVRIEGISARLRERFPTAKEEDYYWSQRDPMGHEEDK